LFSGYQKALELWRNLVQRHLGKLENKFFIDNKVAKLTIMYISSVMGNVNLKELGFFD
jgi:hypothetical protein